MNNYHSTSNYSVACVVIIAQTRGQPREHPNAVQRPLNKPMSNYGVQWYDFIAVSIDGQTLS